MVNKSTFTDDQSLAALEELKTLTLSKIWPSVVPHLAALELSFKVTSKEHCILSASNIVI